jgi:hypothetical protein
MLFMVVERFPNNDPRPLYEHLRDHGRGLPDGLRYVDSWVDAGFGRCFQLMECDDPRLLAEWALHWAGKVELEFVPVVHGSETRRIVLGEE